MGHIWKSKRLQLPLVIGLRHQLATKEDSGTISGIMSKRLQLPLGLRH
jgi:hypothetical protein